MLRESPLLLSTQGLALDQDERTLYVADYAIANSQWKGFNDDGGLDASKRLRRPLVLRLRL